MTAAEIREQMSSQELTEQMAFDLLQDETYREKLKNDSMPVEERDNLLRAMLGVPNG